MKGVISCIETLDIKGSGPQAMAKTKRQVVKDQKLKGVLLSREFNDAIKVKNCHQWWLIRELERPKNLSLIHLEETCIEAL